MWPQRPCSCLTWQLREIFISILLLRDGVTERGCLWWEYRNTPHHPDQGAYLGCLLFGGCSVLFRAIWFCLCWRQTAQHEVTPALIRTWIPCWGSRAHRGGTTEAVWMSGGVTRWDTIVREGTHFNQRVPDDGGRACESRAQTSAPGQWGAIPTAQAGPTSSGKERIFSSKRTTEFPRTAKLERRLFIQGQLSPLGKGSNMVQELPVSLTHCWVCVFIQGCQDSRVPERRDLQKSRDLTSH